MDLRAALETETAASVGYRDLVSVPVAATIREAVSAMQSQSVGCIAVLDGERLAGVFTERDLVTRVLGPERSLDGALSEVMSRDPVVAEEHEPIHRVLARMHARGLRHIPVLGESRTPVGTISIKRSVHFLSGVLPQAIFNLPPEPDRFPDRPEGG